MPLSRIIFWTHSVTGLIVALYVIVIGTTGAVLSFHSEIAEWQSEGICTASGPAVFTADQAIDLIRAAHPNAALYALTFPNQHCQNWSSYLLNAPSPVVNVDAAAPRLIEARQGWLDDLESIHANLFDGPYGRPVNGLGALALILTGLTGAVVWWPGLRRLASSFFLDPRASWSRRIWQLHGMTGVVSVLFLLGLSVTGLYFVASGPFTRAVGAVWPIETKLDYVVLAEVGTQGPRKTYAELVEIAQAFAPGSNPQGITFPSADNLPVRIRFLEGDGTSEVYTSSVLINPYTGEILQRNLVEDRYTGDSIIAWITAFHFGSFGGLWIKTLWALIGSALVFLGLTGPYMWWRRVLAPRLRKRD